jgi:hypothetical protein
VCVHALNTARAESKKVGVHEAGKTMRHTVVDGRGSVSRDFSIKGYDIGI